MGASDTASSWLQTLVQTSGVLITVMFAALSVIIGAGGSQVTVTLKAGAGTLVALSSFLFLGSIWVGKVSDCTIAKRKDRTLPRGDASGREHGLRT